MKTLLPVVCAAAFGVSSCAPVYDDNGAAAPASWWAWVCAAPDGGVFAAPEAGCFEDASPPDADVAE